MATVLALALAQTAGRVSPEQQASGVFRGGSLRAGRVGDYVVYIRDGKTATISLRDSSNGARAISTNGKIDAFIYDLPFNSIAVGQKGAGKFVHLDEPFTKEPLAWAIRRGDPDFLNWLENFMSQIKYDGVYDKIYAKWFHDDAWLKEIQ